MDFSTPNPNSPLSQEHKHMLETESGLTEEVVARRGYQTFSSRQELVQHGWKNRALLVPALYLPIWDVEGTEKRGQLRPNVPRVTDGGRERKYEYPYGQRMLLDCHPSRTKDLLNPKIRLWITEGIKKADSLISLGELCIALMGVWNWRGSNIWDGLTRLADWDSVALNKREIYIVFDNDIVRKPEVLSALHRLHNWLSQVKNAISRVVLLPETPGKMGVDDALITGYTLNDIIDFSTTQLPALPDRKQVDILIALCEDSEPLLDKESREPYTLISVNGHREAVSVAERGGKFMQWVQRRYREEQHAIAQPSELRRAISQFYADFSGDPDLPEHTVFYRVAYLPDEDKIYVDLGDTRWNCVEISASGWIVRNDAPVLFQRTSGMHALPMPEQGGSLALLRDVIPVEPNSLDEVTLWGWLVGVFKPYGACAHLSITGTQGSGKSKATEKMKLLVDPKAALLTDMPHIYKKDDFATMILNNFVLTFDNISSLSEEQYNWLCRAATGFGVSKRRLWTDADELSFSVKRSAIINGIDTFPGPGDVRDRLLTIELKRLPNFEVDEHLDNLFLERRPKILGALFDVVVQCLAKRHETDNTGSVRMADLVRWVEAGHEALGWEKGTFTNIFRYQQRQLAQHEIGASVLGDALLSMLEEDGEIGVNMPVLVNDLFLALTNAVRRGNGVLPKAWPSDAIRASRQLRRLTQGFQEIGWDIQFPSRIGRGQPVVITHTAHKDHHGTDNTETIPF